MEKEEYKKSVLEYEDVQKAVQWRDGGSARSLRSLAEWCTPPEERLRRV